MEHMWETVSTCMYEMCRSYMMRVDDNCSDYKQYKTRVLTERKKKKMEKNTPERKENADT